MNNTNSGMKWTNCYEDECGSETNNDYNFEFDMSEEDDDCFISDIENTCNNDVEEIYQEGFKDGYEKAKQDVLAYMKKNKCCIKCKPRCTNKNNNCNNITRCIR